MNSNMAFGELLHELVFLTILPPEQTSIAAATEISFPQTTLHHAGVR